MKQVKIPDCSNPFVVYINGKKYSYPSGTMQEVPDEVAVIIEQHNEVHKVDYPPVEAPFDPSDCATPQMFGAIGDGVADDTDAIRAAREKAIAEKKALYFPAGTYLVHGTIELWSNCEIYGEGSRSVIKKVPAVTEVLKPAGTNGTFTAEQNTFAVADGSNYTVGQDCYIGVNWENTEGLRGRIESINGNTVTVAAYHTHRNTTGEVNTGVPAGLLSFYNNKAPTVVLSTTFPVFCAVKFTDDGNWNALQNVHIHDLTIDGNRQEDEAKAYVLAAFHLDPLEFVRTTYEQVVVTPHENIRIENLDIYNSPSDGISVQSAKNVCVVNCTTENCGYNGVHFGVGTEIGRIIGCKLTADYSGYFDCVGVNSVSLSGNHFENCGSYGIGGLDSFTRGLTINGNTFRGCSVGIQAGASRVPQAMIDDLPSQEYGNGTPNTGVTICNNAFYGVSLTGVGISFAKGYYFTATGNTFRDLERAIETGETSHVYIADNLIKDCASVLVMGSNDTAKTTDSAFVGNIVQAEIDGTSAAVTIAYAENMLVSGNIVTGTGADVSADESNTRNVVVENNIVAA